MSGCSLCPACKSQIARRVETVSAETLAAAWAREKCHGADANCETIHQYLLADLDSHEVEFWQCQGCGLEFAQPMRSWSARHYPVEQHYLGFDHQVALSDLALMSRVRVLDIGCADGQFLERGTALGHEMIGVDFAAEDVEAAQGRGLNAYVADVNEIGRMFADQPKFEVITLFQIIEHLNEPDAIFSQLNEIAAVDGRLIVGCPSNLRYTRFFKHQQRIQRSDFWDYPPQHTLRWTPKALEIFLQRHGWQTESVLYEPCTIFSAAAHLAGLDRPAARKQGRFRHRLNVLKWMLKVAGLKLFKRTTGVSLLVCARRS
ncbi:MAG TPA: class I SAM-dependent methyltransferase [Pyrinomonadaceae bacterium]|jgi:2-polyprenyl-3-methyl-5-hydroxy-6-metoxy-1,4-benzoquinol methylase